MRIAGEDELVDPDGGVLGDPVGHLGVTADQRGAGTAAHQSDAGPQVGRYLQAAGVAPRPGAPALLVQGHHPPLPLGLAAGQTGLRGAHRLLVQGGHQLIGGLPGLRRGVAGDGVQPDAESDGASLRRGETADPLDLLAYGVRRFSPGQVHVGVPRGHRPGPPANCPRSTGVAPDSAEPQALPPRYQGNRLCA
jgi:hypothetical protein